MNIIKKNSSKIIIILFTLISIISIISLVLSVENHNKLHNLSYFLEPDHTVVWGNTNIWESKVNSPREINLYFSVTATYKEDILWNGKYPIGYFI